MLIDFHSHTTASDGALSPSTLIDRALAENIHQFAITDHDTMAGYQAAAEYYTHIPGQMRLIPGVEFSCRWSGTTIHVVGLDVDAGHPAMSAGLKLLAEARVARGREIAQRLEAKGFAGAHAGALAEAGKSQLGRPHFAQWLVQRGHVEDFRKAFDKYLGQGKIGDVKAFWPELSEVTRWIVESGGVAILAHPLKYRFTRMKLRRLIVDFKLAGGEALEIVNGRQTADQSSQLKRMALEFELDVSAGSDFHRDGSYSPQLGVELRHLGDLRGVWERWSSPQPQKSSK